MQKYVKYSANLWTKPKNKVTTRSYHILGFRLVIASRNTVCERMLKVEIEAYGALRLHHVISSWRDWFSL